MWPAGAGTKLPCPRDSALKRAAFSGNLTALPSHLVPAGRSVRVFISANPEVKSITPVCLLILLSVRGRKCVGPHSQVHSVSPALPASRSSPERVGISLQSLIFFFNSSASLLTSRTHLSSPSQSKI